MNELSFVCLGSSSELPACGGMDFLRAVRKQWLTEMLAFVDLRSNADCISIQKKKKKKKKKKKSHESDNGKRQGSSDSFAPKQTLTSQAASLLIQALCQIGVVPD